MGASLPVVDIVIRAAAFSISCADMRTRGASHLATAQAMQVIVCAVFLDSAAVLGAAEWQGAVLWIHAMGALGAVVFAALIPGEPPYERHGVRLAPSSSASASPIAQLFFTFCNPLLRRCLLYTSPSPRDS